MYDLRISILFMPSNRNFNTPANGSIIPSDDLERFATFGIYPAMFTLRFPSIALHTVLHSPTSGVLLHDGSLQSRV
jgi:hypothetical protein